MPRSSLITAVIRWAPGDWEVRKIAGGVSVVRFLDTGGPTFDKEEARLVCLCRGVAVYSTEPVDTDAA